MRFLRAGPTALLVELDDTPQVLALTAEVARRRAAGWTPSLIDVVPGATTLLLDGVADPLALAEEIASWTLPAAPAHRGPVIEIGCRYDGPDLDEVAAQWQVTADEVKQIHSAALHQVAFCGFTPGFAYLTAMGKQRMVTRRSSPRPKVPAGSVALGGLFTGIYPRPSPGGWQLIGHTEAVLWDPGREPAALLSPGCRVHFVEA